MNTRRKLIRKTLLEALSNCAPYMLDEDTLFNTLVIVIPGKPTRSEFMQEIEALEKDHGIVRLRTSDEVKVKITDEGKAELL